MRPVAAFLSLILVAVSLPLRAAEDGYLPILNSYVSVRLHLEHYNGQMVGAAWLRIRNNTDKPIENIPFILNPGLTVTKVAAGNGTPLHETSAVTPVAGYTALKATVGTAQLATPMAPGGEVEVVIQYRGTLQALGWAGVTGAEETLRPDFTLLRAESFGYPVVAAATKTSIEAAINQPAYNQTATVELPAGYDIAGNLLVQSREPVGSNEKIELKSNGPVGAMVLPIGHFTQSQAGNLNVAIPTVSDPALSAQVISAAAPMLSEIEHLLGTPRKKLKVTFVPDGYGTRTEEGFLMISEATEPTPVEAAVRSATPGLWGLNSHLPGAWDTGLKAVIHTVLTKADRSAAQEAAFKAAASRSFTAKALLGDYPAHDQDIFGTLFFWLLYDQLGEDSFFALARSLRGDLPNSRAGYLTLAGTFADSNSPKSVRTLAESWLEKGKLDKDMKKAKSFADLAKRY